MDQLPTELKDQILFHLDADPPSVDKFAEEPCLETWIQSNSKPLKTLSLVSSGWRQLTLPHLFKHAKLKVDFIYSRNEALEFLELRRFRDFASTIGLHEHTRGLLLYADSLCIDHDLFPTAQDGNVYREAQSFWSTLLPLVPRLRRLAILASPRILANLLYAEIEMLDAWAFDMPLKAIQIQKQPQCTYDDFRGSRPTNYRFGILNRHPTSILDPHNWLSVSTNEGSSLKSYSTYEYFHKTPPSVSESLSTYIFLAHNFGSLRHLSYTAIFPFANRLRYFHDHLLNSWNHLHSLRLQLAPLPASKLTEDPERVGKAQLSDCWLEVERVYHHLARGLGLMLRNQSTFAKGFRQIESLDYVHYDLIREDLNKALAPLKEIGWEMAEEGVWRRPDTEKVINPLKH